MGEGKSRREQIFEAVRKDFKRRRRERVIIVVLALLVGGLFYLSVHFSKIAEESTLIQPFVVYLGYFAFWAFMLVLILVLVFLIVRNVVKFFFERRRGVLGSKIRIRLIAAFTALTIGPAAVLFLLSTFILNTSIEQLYDPHVQNVVKTSKDVIESATRLSDASRAMIEAKYDADGEETVHFAQELARAIIERGWIAVIAEEKKKEVVSPEPEVLPGDTSTAETDLAPAAGDTVETSAIPSAMEQLSHFIEYKRLEYNLALVAVYDKEGKLLVRSVEAELTLPEIEPGDVQKAISGAQGYTPPAAAGKGAVLYSFYPVPRRAESGEAEIVGAVVAGRYVTWVSELDWSTTQVAEEARGVIKDYETLTRLERPLKFSYFVLLVFVTLIVIFLAIWFGFRMSKGLTEPIQLLAEGTEMVASGNLDFRIDVPLVTDDEISVLVKSFNKMTEDLAKGRTDLDAALSSLHETNLELETRRRYIETVISHVGAGVISIDKDERISTVNAAALNMIGKDSESQILGRHLSEVFRPEDMEVFRGLAGELDRLGGQMVQRQITMVREKRSFVVLLTLSLLTGEDGERQGTVIVIDDMTELIRAHRAMAWREVARRIAHEIKNPLTPIQLAAQRLERRYTDHLSGEEAVIFTECTRTIIRQVEELKHLVNEFSLFARLPSTQPEPSDLHQIIHEVLSLYREAHSSIEFALQEDEKVPVLDLDREQIKRVFINLIDNAVASIEGEGKISVETMYNEQLHVVRIEVADNGSGLLPEVKQRLFEPYYSTKPGGSGLGLTIVQRIIADHYGYIRVVDNRPGGTRIIIELPAVIAERRVTPEEHARTM